MAIETSRRQDGAYRDLIGWGQSAALCLLECLHGPAGAPPVEVLASGAVRSPLDVVRGLALGARAVGVSGHFMRTLTESGPEALVDELVSWTQAANGPQSTRLSLPVRIKDVVHGNAVSLHRA